MRIYSIEEIDEFVNDLMSITGDMSKEIDDIKDKLKEKDKEIQELRYRIKYLEM